MPGLELLGVQRQAEPTGRSATRSIREKVRQTPYSVGIQIGERHRALVLGGRVSGCYRRLAKWRWPPRLLTLLALARARLRKPHRIQNLTKCCKHACHAILLNVGSLTLLGDQNIRILHFPLTCFHDFSKDAQNVVTVMASAVHNAKMRNHPPARVRCARRSCACWIRRHHA